MGVHILAASQADIEDPVAEEAAYLAPDVGADGHDETDQAMAALSTPIRDLMRAYVTLLGSVPNEPFVSFGFIRLYTILLRFEFSLIALPFVGAWNAAILASNFLTKSNRPLKRSFAIETCRGALRSLRAGEIPGLQFLTLRVAVDAFVTAHVLGRTQQLLEYVHQVQLQDSLGIPHKFGRSDVPPACRALVRMRSVVRSRFAGKLAVAVTPSALASPFVEKLFHVRAVPLLVVFVVAPYIGWAIVSALIRKRELCSSHSTFGAEDQFRTKTGIDLPREFPWDLVIAITSVAVLVVVPVLTHLAEPHELVLPDAASLKILACTALLYCGPLAFALRQRVRSSNR